MLYSEEQRYIKNNLILKKSFILIHIKLNLNKKQIPQTDNKTEDYRFSLIHTN